jgi:ParB family chromosome partitioning protein
MNAIKNMLTMKVEEVNVEDILEHPDVPNIRQKISGTELKELIESIRVSGVMNPLSCFKIKDDPKTYLESGFRRLAACKELKIKTVPVLFKNYEEDPIKSALYGNFIENAQRVDVNGFDLATRVQKLLDMGISKDDIAKNLGKSRTYIDTTLKFLSADPKLHELVRKGDLTLSEGKNISRLDPDIQAKVGEGLAQAKNLENIAGNGKKTTKGIKKAIDEAGRVRSSVAPSKKEIEVEQRKAETIFKALRPEIDPAKKPSSKQEVYWGVNIMLYTLKWSLGLVKDLNLDKQGKNLGIDFDEKGNVVIEEPEEKETKAEKKEAKAEKAPAKKKASPAPKKEKGAAATA